MTDEMLALARENQSKVGADNVEFLKGENIPLLDNSVDVIISNCVINLSGDKDRVLSEAYRVLKPGGRFVLKLAKAGFDSVDIEPTHIYSIDTASQFLAGEGIDVDGIAAQVGGKFISALIRAVKPASKESCGPTCCS